MMTLARPHWKSAIAVAVLLMCTVVVVTRDTVTHSATPPAEFVSVGFSPYQADNPSISADGGLVAYDYQNDTENDLNVRNRSVPNTETLTPFGTARAYPYDLQISRDGCQTVWTQDVAVTPESSANRAAIIAQNRCTGAAPVELYLGSDVQSTSGFSSLSISTRGRYVAFNDYSAHTVIRLDRDTNANGVLDDSTQAVATTPAGDLAQDPSLGDDAISGKMSLTAQVTGSKLYEIYVWDPSNPAAPLLLVSSAEGSTTDPVPYQSITSAMTPDARYVVFDMVLRIVTGKTATNIDQIVVRDTVTNHNAIISRDANGNYANGRSVQPSISADGTQIAFGTLSNNIPIVPAVGGVIGANNEGSFDLLVARSLTGYFDTLTYDRVSLKPDGTPVDTTHPFQGRQYMDIPRISANGRWVAFGSSYNDELQNGGTSSANSADLAPEVYVIGRPTAVSGSAVSFGSVNVGATTAAKLVTITNTGISSFLPARISTTGNFTAVGGGTCTINVYLSPGQSCTVAVRFKPTAAGARSGVLTVAETGFGAISAAVKLSGTGVAVVTTTSSTSTTTTTSTTMPATAQLTITPNPGSFGLSIVGVAAAPINFTVTSTGTATAAITDVGMSGTNPTNFAITADGCTGAQLAPGATCPLTVTFTPTGAGAMTAVLNVNAGKASITDNLDGAGVFEPIVHLMPNVISLGEVAVAMGSGFPPNAAVQFQWAGDPRVFAGTTDANGSLNVQIPVRSDELIGPRTFTAVDQPGLFSGLTVPGLIVETSVQPPAAADPAFPFPSIFVRA